MTSPQQLEITPILVLSTAHIHPATAAILYESAETMGGGQYGEYGWFFYCSEEQGNLPDDLFTAMVFALSHGCVYVLFDCDAPTVDGLQTWEW
jgi:hypothetical protein